MINDNLYFITNANSFEDLFSQVKEVIEGGCKLIQLRLKDVNDNIFMEYAEKINSLCKEFGVKLIINDNIIVAKEINAYGVHLGKNDIPVSEARKILGDNFIIGATANTIEDIDKSVNLGADYIGLGPFRFTSTKKNLSPILGVEGVQNILQEMKKRKIDIPLYLIGGIRIDDIQTLKKIGITRVAVSSEITRAENIKEITKKIIKLLED